MRSVFSLCEKSQSDVGAKNWSWKIAEALTPQVLHNEKDLYNNEEIGNILLTIVKLLVEWFITNKHSYRFYWICSIKHKAMLSHNFIYGYIKWHSDHNQHQLEKVLICTIIQYSKQSYTCTIGFMILQPDYFLVIHKLLNKSNG